MGRVSDFSGSVGEGDEEGVGDEGDTNNGEGNVDAEDWEVKVVVDACGAGEFGRADVDDSVEIKNKEGPEECGSELHCLAVFLDVGVLYPVPAAEDGSNGEETDEDVHVRDEL